MEIETNPWEFIDSLASLQLATVNPNGTPHISYAPFVREDDVFYIFASQMAAHNQNLKAFDKASIMFIEDESKSANIFARRRVTFELEVQSQSRGTTRFEEVLTKFEKRFGDYAQIYRNLGDFELFRLKALSGRAVFGFGKTLRYKGEGLFV